MQPARWVKPVEEAINPMWRLSRAKEAGLTLWVAALQDQQAWIPAWSLFRLEHLDPETGTSAPSLMKPDQVSQEGLEAPLVLKCVQTATCTTRCHTLWHNISAKRKRFFMDIFAPNFFVRYFLWLVFITFGLLTFGLFDPKPLLTKIYFKTNKVYVDTRARIDSNL